MTVLVDGKYYEDATYNTQFISVMNGEAVPVPAQFVIAATAYADAKVTDSITEDVTTVAPSQNAVFDALGLKADLTYTEYLMMEGDPA